MEKEKYKVGFRELKYLVDGLESYGMTRKGAIDWCKERKDKITPEFMARIYDAPDSFFYYETHLREDEVLDISLEELCEML